jgi:transglutaminase-like putative cysteine protease
MIQTNQQNRGRNRPNKGFVPAGWREENIRSSRQQRKALWNNVVKYTGHPVLVAYAAKLIQKYDIPQRNEKELVITLHRFVQDYIKYFRENPERFVSPIRVLEWRIGDCDCKTGLLASLVRSFRIPVRLKIIRFKLNGKRVAHIYPQAKLEKQWWSLETVNKWPIGADLETLLKQKNISYKVEYVGDK